MVEEGLTSPLERSRKCVHTHFYNFLNKIAAQYPTGETGGGGLCFFFYLIIKQYIENINNS